MANNDKKNAGPIYIGPFSLLTIAIVAIIIVGAITVAAVLFNMLGREKEPLQPASTPPSSSAAPAPAPSSSTPPPSSSVAPKPSSSTPPASSAPPAPSYYYLGGNTNAGRQTYYRTNAITGTYDTAVMTTTGAENIPAYAAVNTDVKGWLRIPNTNMNYPVLYYAADNLYYNDKDIYRNPSRDGVIWADCECSSGTAAQLPRNTVLYGHNWTNVGGYVGSLYIGNYRPQKDVMMAQMHSFHDLAFAQQTPYIYFSTAQQQMAWVVFAVCYTSVTDTTFPYSNWINPTDANFINLVNGARERSLFNYDVEIATTDKILTLSTCTRVYSPTRAQETDNCRFLVLARLLREGESIMNPVTVTMNPSPKQPAL